MITVIIYGIINGLLISLLAIAFQINFKIYKIFDLSQAGLYVSTSYFFIKLSALLYPNTQLSSILIVILTCVFSWIVSLLIYNLVYKRFFAKKTSSLALMIISIAIYIIIINITAIIYGSETQIINIDESSFVGIQTGIIIITPVQLLQFVISLPTVLLILLILNKKQIGKQITALSENKELLSTLGYNINKIRIKALVISSSLVAIVSILKSIEHGIEPYNFGFHSILMGIIAALIGGINSFKGAAFGGLFIGIINSVGSWFFSGEWQETTAYVMLLVVLTFKKEGFFNINLRLEE
ncbi:branched-chain amino acid ABC transporter permease [Pontimicrobium sp. MEBiC06410]